MKASESNAHFASKARESTNFAAREIKKVCKEIGPRPSCSESEAKALDYVESSMQKFSDAVERKSFSACPKAYTDRGTVMGALLIAAALLIIIAMAGLIPQANRIMISASGILTCTAIAVWAFDGVMKLFCKSSESGAVVCTKKATGDTKRRIILAGNIDSPYEQRFGGKGMIIAVLASVVSTACVTLSYFHLPNAARIVLLAVVCLTIPCYIIAMLSVNKKNCIQGAASNLTGVFASMAALQYLKDNGVAFENTEVVAAAVGCGEAGHGGARTVAEMYKDSVETVFISVNELQSYEHFAVNEKVYGEASKLLKNAAAESGITLKELPAPVGDADAVKKCGMKAAVLSAADVKSESYRTMGDTADKIDMKTLEGGVKIILEAIFAFDEKGI